MKKTMAAILAWVVVLGLGVSAASRTERVPEEKLINANDIIAGFEQGKEKVKVIVNLVEPQKIRSTTDWNSMQSLEKLHSEVMATQAPVLSTLSTNEFKLRHRFTNQAGFSGEVTLEGLAKLLSHPRVESIEPVYILEKTLKQGIPLINPSVYRPTYNGQGVSIAICDDGIDYRHPKLGGGGFPNNKVIGGYDLGNNDSDPLPNTHDAHGTACAGIAAGDLGNYSDYIGGVAYRAKLLALKVSESDGEIRSDTLVQALNWCVTHKNDDTVHPILVVSISLGHGRFYSACDVVAEPALTRAANNAVAAGITVLAGSGNDGYCDSIAQPACLGNVISVGAVYDADFGRYAPCVAQASCATKYPADDCPTGWYAIDGTRTDMVTSNSSTAPFLDILAPGACAYTTDIIGYSGDSVGDYTSCFGGTSASCAYAAGAVACLQSASKAYNGRYLTPSEVRDLLKSTGDDITDSKVDITKPRVNLGLAIDSLRGVECDNITIGTGTSDWDYPMHTGYEDSRTEVIYLPNEIGQSGTIRALALDVTKVPGRTMNNWTIRMTHVALFLHCYLHSTDWTVVYQNDETVDGTGWRWFEFQTPFEYSGQDNLLVDFSHNNSSSSSHGKCRSHSRFWLWGFLDHNSACAHSDGLYGDPLNWSGSTRPIVRCSNERPNIKLKICKQRRVVFEDTFPTATIDSTNWTVVNGATVDDVGINEPSSAYSLRLNSNDSVESKVIDLSSCEDAILTYYYQRTGGGSSTENGDDLIIEYRGRAHQPDGRDPRPQPPPHWIELARHPGEGPDMTIYEQNTIALPSTADFRLRIRTSNSSVNDDWFVDDVKIEGTYSGIPPR